MASKSRWRLDPFTVRFGVAEQEWEDYLVEVLLTKPAEIVQEAIQVLEEHGCNVKELKSELYCSSTL